MKKKCNGFYFDDIKINIHFSGIFSENADVCVIPQYSKRIALTGPSATIIHSRARNSITAFQNYLSAKKILPFGKVFATTCDDNHYNHLLQISVLDCPSERASQIITMAIKNALKKAEKLEAKTIVIPEINIAALPKLAILSAVKDHAKEAETLQEVTLICNSKQACREYAQIAFELLNN